MPESVLADADRAARFVVEQAKLAAGARWHQGFWQPPLADPGLAEGVDVIARQRVWRVERTAAESIVAWARGERDVELRTDIPHYRELLSLQARGRRAVSLLPEGAATAPHANPMAFAVHDLCHLEKFHDPEHHLGQVGFFAMVEAALATPELGALSERFDAAWGADLEHVVADMNGSAIYLFAALKMKLKMAARREHARRAGITPPASGALNGEELACFAGALEILLDALALHASAREAARAVTARRSEPDMAARLLAVFEQRGRDALVHQQRVGSHQ